MKSGEAYYSSPARIQDNPKLSLLSLALGGADCAEENFVGSIKGDQFLICLAPNGNRRFSVAVSGFIDNNYGNGCRIRLYKATAPEIRLAFQLQSALLLVGLIYMIVEALSEGAQISMLLWISGGVLLFILGSRWFMLQIDSDPAAERQVIAYIQKLTENKEKPPTLKTQ